MDAFEQIVAGLLRQEGYWTWNGYKINLSKPKKVEIGKPSMPRPEIDILAYQPQQNELLWVECKSYLWSRGVTLNSIANSEDPWASHYKIFTQDTFRKIVEKELIDQVVRDKLTLPNPTVRYCLATGHITSSDERRKLKEHFEKKGWTLFDEDWLKKRLDKLAAGSYEDDVAVIMAKLLARIREDK